MADGVLGVVLDVATAAGIVRDAISLGSDLRMKGFTRSCRDACACFKMSDDDVRRLSDAGLNSKTRERIYQGAKKSILAESFLAVRMIATLTAKHVLNHDDWTVDDTRMLRTLTQVVDDEIIFLDEIVGKYWEISNGKRVTTIGGRQFPDEEVRKISPQSVLKDLLSLSDDRIIDTVEQLKSLGLLDSDIRFIAQKDKILPRGAGAVSPFSESFIRLYRLTLGATSNGEDREERN